MREGVLWPGPACGWVGSISHFDNRNPIVLHIIQHQSFTDNKGDTWGLYLPIMFYLSKIQH